MLKHNDGQMTKRKLPHTSTQNGTGYAVLCAAAFAHFYVSKETAALLELRLKAAGASLASVSYFGCTRVAHHLLGHQPTGPARTITISTLHETLN